MQCNLTDSLLWHLLWYRWSLCSWRLSQLRGRQSWRWPMPGTMQHRPQQPTSLQQPHGRASWTGRSLRYATAKATVLSPTMAVAIVLSPTTPLAIVLSPNMPSAMSCRPLCLWQEICRPLQDLSRTDLGLFYDISQGPHSCGSAPHAEQSDRWFRLFGPLSQFMEQ